MNLPPQPADIHLERVLLRRRHGLNAVAPTSLERKPADVHCVAQHPLAGQVRLPVKGWQPFREGVEIFPLFAAGEDGAAAAMLRYAPGAKVPRHLHPGEERIIILCGSQRDERGTYDNGAVVVNEPGSVHEVISDDGCVALVYWALPVRFLDADAP